MERLHVGRGTVRGGLTVFPIWGEHRGRGGYTVRLDAARVGEQTSGPTVGTLVVTNLADRPLLMFEGQVLEGGWQTRMLTRSMLVAPRTEQDLEVVCIEQGRWGGVGPHRLPRRRGSLRIRSGLRAADRQIEVWRRVGEYDERYGANPTSSYVEHADRAERDVVRLVHELSPFSGQVGVLVGIGGQPVYAEVFEKPSTLAMQYRSIVTAAAMDALGQPAVATPSRRARRFVDWSGQVRLSATEGAGLGISLRGSSEHAEVSALGWQGRRLHAVLTNPRHELNLVAA